MGKDDMVHATGNIIRIEAGSVNIAVSYAFGLQLCVSHINNPDPMKDDTNPRCHGTQSTNKPVFILRTA